MQIVAPSAARTAMFAWQDLDGRPRLTIVAKWTFRLGATGLGSDPEPLPVLLADELDGDDPRRPPRLESDCAPMKPRADVVLVGRAHAPAGRPVDRLVAGFRVGTLRRRLLVVGERRWRTRTLGRPSIEGPEPFTTMDLGWERAYGGATASRVSDTNPVGRGLVFAKDAIDGTPLPNLEDPRHAITCWTDRPAPMGVGFVGRGWAPRRALAGVSHAFHNGAPAEQQVDGYLRGDEEVELVHLGRQPHVRFRLPGLRPQLTVARWSLPPLAWLAAHAGMDAEPPLREDTVTPALDTLVLLPEEGRLYLVYRAVCDLASADSLEVARVTVRL
jgi:hypothetical protein